VIIDRFDPLKGEQLKILDKDGNVIDKSLEPALSRDTLRSLYKWMVFAREADRKALKLQRQGRMGTYAPIEGQEACEVGSALACEKQDWMVVMYRNLGAAWAFGMPLKGVYQYWMGWEVGNKAPEGVNCLPISIPVGTQPLHAVGIGMAMRLKGESGKAVIVYNGDGGTSKGDFYGALNFSGVFQAPTVFFVENNQFAISYPRKRQTAAKTIAQKGVACGVPGVQVDGNDVLAVFVATKEAMDRARSGGGPTLIEGVTYRMGPHTTVDDPNLYRSEEEVNRMRDFDPIKRMRNYLATKGLWDESWEKQVLDEASKTIEAATAEAEATPTHTPEEITEYMFAERTPRLREQTEWLKEMEKLERGPE
jgi:pyruvate dehydrogenase E1 component alpha subunit